MNAFPPHLDNRRRSNLLQTAGQSLSPFKQTVDGCCLPVFSVGKRHVFYSNLSDWSATSSVEMFVAYVQRFACCKHAVTVVIVKVNVGFLYSATYTVDQEQPAVTISEGAVDCQETMVLQSKCGHPLPALTDIGPAVAASKHTTAPINHTRRSPRKHSPDVTTPSEMAEKADYCLLLIYRPRKDERLSWPIWLTCSGWPTHISGNPAATGQAQDREVRRPKDRRSTTIPRNQKLQERFE